MLINSINKFIFVKKIWLFCEEGVKITFIFLMNLRLLNINYIIVDEFRCENCSYTAKHPHRPFTLCSFKIIPNNLIRYSLRSHKPSTFYKNCMGIQKVAEYLYIVIDLVALLFA
jgi:hypothetical protein